MLLDVFTPVVTEIRTPPADAGPDTFVSDLTTPRAATPATTTRGAAR
jgi:hypothetical protein